MDTATERQLPPHLPSAILTQTKSSSVSAGTPSSPTGLSFGMQKKPAGRGGTKRLGVDEQGQYYYKNTPSSTLMTSIQLGLQHSIGSMVPKPHRDILMTDFEVVENSDFPAAGSDITPAHKCKDFTFKTYSPEAFRFFREAFGILPEDFLLAMCDEQLREVSNPGASGSLFYLSADDAFIIKTVQKKEARFLQKLLPGYYLNMTQHKRTLLPKFFGLYRYKSGSVNIRIVVMNNLLPSGIQYHEKYDLKGSTYKRKSNPRELKKKSPTYKDLDFMERHEEGIILGTEKFEALLHSVERDCKVLESFGIMDYSLLLGVHNIDLALREKAEDSNATDLRQETMFNGVPVRSRIGLSKNYSIVSTENIPSLVPKEQQLRHHYPEGYIQGRIHGDRVMFYLGIIDILQSYRLKKKIEHGFKSIITDASTVSVHNPSFYARRFQDFMTKQVFKKDKAKYRTRKNSTSVQLRGRRMVSNAVASTGRGGGGGASVGDAYDRQMSRDSRNSPLHEPPSYTQVMTGTGVPTKLAVNIARQRSSSLSVVGNLPVYPALSPPIAMATSYKVATSSTAKMTFSPVREAISSSSSSTGEEVASKPKLQRPLQLGLGENVDQRKENKLPHKQKENVQPEILQQEEQEQQQQQQPPVNQRVEGWTGGIESDVDCKKTQAHDELCSSMVVVVDVESGEESRALNMADHSEFAQDVCGTSIPRDGSHTYSSDENLTVNLSGNIDQEAPAKMDGGE